MSRACDSHGGRNEILEWFYWKSLKEIGYLQDLGIDQRIILEWMLRKQDGGCGLHSSGLGQGREAGCCEHRNEP